jgi:hypothetical protein
LIPSPRDIRVRGSVVSVCFSGAGLHGGCEPGGHSSKLSDLVLAPPGESFAHHFHTWCETVLAPAARNIS